jgi:hypothetical protein
VGHTVFQHQIGEIGESQQARPLPPQFQNAHDQRAVVASLFGGADGESLVQMAAGGGVIHISQHRQIIGRLQGKAPAFQPLAHGAFASRGDSRGRQAGQFRHIGKHQFEGVGGIEHVLPEPGGDLRQFDVDLFQPFLSRGVQIGPMTAKGVDGLMEEAPAFACRRLALRGGREGLDALPQPVVQRNPRVEGAHLRLYRIESRPQLGVGGYRLQVLHHSHGVVQRLRQPVECIHTVPVGAFAGQAGDGIEARACLRE